jgi:hypothetical protein
VLDAAGVFSYWAMAAHNALSVLAYLAFSGEITLTGLAEIPFAFGAARRAIIGDKRPEQL